MRAGQRHAAQASPSCSLSDRRECDTSSTAGAGAQWGKKHALWRSDGTVALLKGFSAAEFQYISGTKGRSTVITLRPTGAAWQVLATLDNMDSSTVQGSIERTGGSRRDTYSVNNCWLYICSRKSHVL
jgi:hypothetical protein